jgi:hypothetical protein
MWCFRLRQCGNQAGKMAGERVVTAHLSYAEAGHSFQDCTVKVNLTGNAE